MNAARRLRFSLRRGANVSGGKEPKAPPHKPDGGDQPRINEVNGFLTHRLFAAYRRVIIQKKFCIALVIVDFYRIPTGNFREHF